MEPDARCPAALAVRVLAVAQRQRVRVVEDRGGAVSGPDPVRDGPLVRNRQDHDAALFEGVFGLGDAEEVVREEHFGDLIDSCHPERSVSS